MKLKNGMWIAGIAALLSACGINGQRGTSQTSSSAVTAIQPFKTLSIQTSVGPTSLALATGTINSSDPLLIQVGEMKYLTTEKSHDNSTLAERTNVLESDDTFPVFWSLGKKKVTQLVTVIPKPLKNSFLNPVLSYENRTVGINGTPICDEYTAADNPFLGAWPIEYKKFRCSFETGQCTNVLQKQSLSALDLDQDPQRYRCTGVRQLFYPQKVLIKNSKAITAVRVSILKNENDIGLKAEEKTLLFPL